MSSDASISNSEPFKRSLIHLGCSENSPESSPDTVSKEDNGSITLTQRMVSACSGSLITSLLVTPFDVIRIRIQQQQILQPNACCQGQPTPGNSKLVKEYATKSFAAVKQVANAASPEIFWQHKTFCESAKDCSKITSTAQGFALITRNEGLPTLWRGLSLTLLMAVPSNIIYFTGYEYIRDHSPFIQHALNPLFCGSLARLMAATFVSPIELIKTRLQSIPAAKSSLGPKHNILADLLKDSWKMVRSEGVGVLFTGLQLTLWRDVPFSGVYWLSYEFFKKRTTDIVNNHHYLEGLLNDELKVLLTSFVSGSVSGFSAALVTNPFDVGKTRMQITSHEDRGKVPRAKEPSMFRFLTGIYRNEGLAALYAGFGPRAMKIVPSCAIMISTYEIGKKFFNKDKI